MIQLLFANILEISLTASAVILAVYALSPILEQKYMAKWFYYIWLLIAIRLLIPIPFTLPDAPIQISPERIFEESASLQSTSLPGILIGEVVQPEKPANSASNISLLQLGAIIWIVGAFAFSIYHMLQYFCFIKNVKRWILQPDSDQEFIFSKLKSDLEIKGAISLHRCKTVKIPMMFGIIHPAVLIPCIDYPQTDLYLVLKHELMHYKRHDIEAKILMFVVQALYWFNPFVHLMSNQFNQALEMKCDEYVIGGIDAVHKKRYMETLLVSIKNQDSGTSVFTSNYTGGVNLMKKRFLNIVHSNGKRKGFVTLAMLLIACFGASSLVACTSSGSVAQEETQVQAAGKAHTSESIEEKLIAKAQTKAKPIDGDKQVQIQAQESKSLSANIIGIYAESKPNPALEKTIISELGIPDEYLDKTKYYYNYVDLNCDGRDEIFAVAMGPYTSGTGGSTALIVVQANGEMHVNQVLTLIHTPVIISDKITKGCREIIAMKRGGGANGNYAVLTCSDGYYKTVNEGAEISNLDGISGKAIISNDILKDMEEGKALYLHPVN